jgi:SWI/SNF-related matrix-associated actin-dependent regulator 1 of chromatin subfamily A
MAEKNSQGDAHWGLHSDSLFPVSTNICNFDHLLPEGEELYDFQHVGVGYALVQTLDGKGCFICDEQGLGKTRQGIVICKAKGCKRILIIAKNSILGNWEAEVNRCAPEWDVQVLKGRQPYELLDGDQDTTAVIISFDLLAAWADALAEFQFDAVLIDESHHVKSMGSPRKPVQRTVAALQVCEGIRARKGLVLLLSGTPFLNKPVELLPQLEMIGRLKDITPQPKRGDGIDAWRKTFKSFYCWNDEKQDYSGSQRPNLLNTRARGYGFLRRLRNDVLNLDDTHRIHTPLDLNGAMANYWRIEQNFTPKHPNSYYIELLGQLRQAAGLAKIPAAVEWVQDFLTENEGKKLVVWAWHIPVQRGIADALNKAGVKAIYWGAAKGKTEIEALKREFNEGEAQVLVCSLQMHAFGHTLVGDGKNVTDSLFVESPWHPGAVAQAEDRINRIGREAAAVFAHTLVAPGTVDEWLVDLIASKWDVFKATVEGNVPEGEEAQIQRLLIDKLRAYMLAKYGIGPNGPVAK